MLATPAKPRLAVMHQIVSPNNAVLVIGRVFVASEGALPTAHALATQMQLRPPNDERR